MTVEEAVEIVLQGAINKKKCGKCGGTGRSFKGGGSVGNSYSAGESSYVRSGDCAKCAGYGKIYTKAYHEARALLRMAPVEKTA